MSENSSDQKRTAFLETLITRYFDRQSEKNQEEFAEDESFDREGVYDKVMTAISEKKSSSHKWIPILRIAASILLVSSLASLLYLKRAEIALLLNPEKMVERKTEKGQTMIVKLEDGSKVWLNSDSKLIYPEHFNGKSRNIKLVGEAYFEVVHLAKQPFTIESERVKTVVLGTSFNIRAYPGNKKVEVTVLTGKVAVYTPNGKKETFSKVYVTPDQKVTYAGEDIRLRPYSVKAEESIDWKEGKMLFNATPLAEVIEEIERKYNVKLNCSDKIRECPITTTADLKNEGLNKTLRIIAGTVNASLSYQDGTYYLDGKGCE